MTLEEFQASANSASLAALESAQNVRSEEIKQVKSEDEVKLEELQKQRDDIEQTMNELSSKGTLSAYDSDRFFEALDILDGAIYAQAQKIKESQELEGIERAKSNLETTLDGLGDPLTMGEEEFKKTLAGLKESFKSAEGLGVDTSTYKAQVLDALNAAASQITPTIDSSATLNAFEALDMTRRDDTDILRQQRDYLREMAGRLDDILKGINQRNDEGGDLI